jgi:hypothetical protein
MKYLTLVLAVTLIGCGSPILLVDPTWDATVQEDTGFVPLPDGNDIPDTGNMPDGNVIPDANEPDVGEPDGGVIATDSGNLPDVANDSGFIEPDGGVITPDTDIPDSGYQQDGGYKPDAGLNCDRFSKASRQVTTVFYHPDNKTIWSLNGSFDKTLELAEEFCACHGDGSWRLPSIDEYRTLTNCKSTKTGGGCGVTDTCLATNTNCYKYLACNDGTCTYNWINNFPIIDGVDDTEATNRLMKTHWTTSKDPDGVFYGFLFVNSGIAPVNKDGLNTRVMCVKSAN